MTNQILTRILTRILTLSALLAGIAINTNIYALGKPESAQMSENVDFVWHNGLRKAHFGDREIIESDDFIGLEAPAIAEDATTVPLKIRARKRQSEASYIKTITLLIDQNPAPLAGRFHFTPKSGQADLAMRVRVNSATQIRAVAETNDGKLYMSTRFVQASGGCSAPAAGDMDAALARLGKIRLKLKAQISRRNEPTPTQVNISHPNITGLQLDQATQTYIPAHFVKQIKVSFEGEPVMMAETDIAISQDPSFQFYFIPHKEGELQIEAVDNKNMAFSKTFSVKPF